jgi:hypothetical protein
MNLSQVVRSGALFAINLLFLMVWGFAGLGKLHSGFPPSWQEKFANTFLATFPGVKGAFWLVAAAEVAAFLLAAAALLRGEFLRLRPPACLVLVLMGSLYVFVMLAFGLFLTSDFTGTFQMFVYFGVTLLALQYASQPKPAPQEAHPR